MSQGIYRFDPDLFEAVWNTPLEGGLPVDLLYRLPEWCVYVETPGKGAFHWDLHGFFAHLDWDANTGRSELRRLLDTEGNGFLPYAIHLDLDGLKESVERMLKEAERQERRYGIRIDRSPATAALIAGEIAPLVSLVLYLCAANAEIRDADGTARRPGRPAPKRVKGGERYFPPARSTVWECGWRTGPALRAARQADRAHEAEQGSEGSGRASPRLHLRRAHWHHDHVGPRSRSEQQQRIMRWLPPIPVAVSAPEDRVATVREVPGP